MTHEHIDSYGQPIGFPLPDWTPPPPPPRETLTGQYCRVEPLDGARHAAEFHAANALEPDLRGWTYLTYGPFSTEEDCRRWADASAQRDDYLFHAIIDESSGKVGGIAAYMRIDTANGSIEIGGIKYTPLIAQQPDAVACGVLAVGGDEDAGVLVGEVPEAGQGCVESDDLEGVALDEVGVGLGHNPSLDLHGRGELAAVDGEGPG